MAFPEHTHDYVEMVCMCRGSTSHTVNGRSLTLREGELARERHYECSTLSRLIRQQTGKSYTELVQEKRLSQAAWLLRHSDLLIRGRAERM